MTPKRPKARVSGRAPKGKPAESIRKTRTPRYDKDDPRHPQNRRLAERARKAAQASPETKPERTKRIKRESMEERGDAWANASLAANLNDSRILQLRRLYAHLSEAKEKQSLGNVVKLEQLIAKIQGTLEPAPVGNPDAEKAASGGTDPYAQFAGWTQDELDRYANGGREPTEKELAERARMVN